MPTPRQELILRKVVEGYLESGMPVGSKTLATDPELQYGPSTIRNELALLEEHGYLAHQHTSAGRVPTDVGYRFFVDRLLSERRPAARPNLELQLVRREVDEAMRATTEALSQVTNLLAVVTAPPVDTATIRHIEVLTLQPQVLMVVIITSTGGVSKRIFTFERPVDPGLTTWASAYLNEELAGLGLADYTSDPHTENWTLKVRGKGNKERMVPITESAAAAVDDWLDLRGREPGPLFLQVSQTGVIGTRPLSPRGVYDVLGKRLRQAGVAHATPHDFRRTVGGDLLDAGVDIVTVKDLLGHASVETTALYDRRGQRRLREASRKLHFPYTRRRQEVS